MTFYETSFVFGTLHVMIFHMKFHMWIQTHTNRAFDKKKSVIKAKGGYLKNLKYKIYFDLFNTFLVTT